VIGHPDVDPGHRALVALGRADSRRDLVAPRRLLNEGICGRERHHELGVTASQSQLDRPRCELGGDLLRRRGQGVLQGKPDRRVERRGETLCERTSLVSPCLGGDLQLVVDALDVRSDIHGAMMASSRCQCQPFLASY